MNRIQQLAAYVPYMTCPGNHGEWCVFWGGGGYMWGVPVHMCACNDHCSSSQRVQATLAST